MQIEGPKNEQDMTQKDSSSDLKVENRRLPGTSSGIVYPENFVPLTPDAAQPIEHPMVSREIKRYPGFEGELTPHVIDLLNELCFVPEDRSPSDLIFVMGGHLYLDEFGRLLQGLLDEGVSKTMLITGGRPRYEDTAAHSMSEADMLISLVNAGKDYSNIHFILEDQATNFKENVVLGMKEVEGQIPLDTIHSITVVCEPSAAGRALMYFPNYLGQDVVYRHVSFDPVYAPHTDRGLNVNTWTDNDFGVSRVIGEFARIDLYSKKGDLVLTDRNKEVVKELGRLITLKS